MYKQVLDPVSSSLGLSALVAAIPVLLLFVLLGILRMRAWLASIIALAAAVIIAVVVYPMPLGQALDAGSEGAAFGFWPILWIVINAVWIYNMTVQTGHFDVLRRSFGRVSDDHRAQAVIIAFCFGALLEALAGFGAPVAICAVMLIALGFRPIKAVTLALVADTAPVAFGALAIPITTLAKVTGLKESTLGAMVGRQTPILSFVIPFALVFIVDKGRGLRQAWPVAFTAGLVFGLGQYITSNFISVALADVVASLLATLAIVLLLRVWHPRETYRGDPDDGVYEGADSGALHGRPAVAGGSVDEPTKGFRDRVEGRGGGRVATAGGPGAGGTDSRGQVFLAYAPYLIIILVLVLASLPFIKGVAPTKPGETGTGINALTHLYKWPGLHVVNSKGKPLSTIPFKLDYLAATGTLLLIAGILTMIVLRVGIGSALRAYGATLAQLWTAIVTVMAVLALAFVMNDSGQTVTIGKWAAGAGSFFAFLSPLLGWLGVAVTGSDTSSNSLFGLLQVQAANGAHLSPTLMAAGNSSGGVLGKMISPQNLAIGAAAVGMSGREGELFRKVIGWSLGFALFMAVLVYLQSTSVLSWMVVK